jgi:hypothetical protein
MNELKKPILLVFGNVCSGKSTLIHNLVELGLYDVSVETDDLWRWVSGAEKHPWRMSNPKCSGYRAAKNEVASHVLRSLEKAGFNVVCTAWPGEVRPVLEKVQDYRCIFLIGPEFAEAQARWLRRGQTVGDWNDALPGDAYMRNDVGISRLYDVMESRGKLADLDDYKDALLDWMHVYPKEHEEEE